MHIEQISMVDTGLPAPLAPQVPQAPQPTCATCRIIRTY